MADLDKALLEDQLGAVAAKIATFPRYGRGYQGKVEVEDVIVVVCYRGADGQRYYADPSEINDGHPDLFLREYVTVGSRKGVSVKELLDKYLPLISPKAAGLWGALKGLFGQ